MEKLTATQIFESLSSGIRLDIYRLLVKRGLEGMVSGQIASAFDLPPNNTSFHLKAMPEHCADLRAGSSCTESILPPISSNSTI
uniref:Arsenic operon regulator n=1 Tax=mine drainage metagenome TaxID=410659 RepID=E6QVL7_9ZZZZ